jgi:cell wall-associated NlpC family hydrolase
MATVRSFTRFLLVLFVAGCATQVADRPAVDAGASAEAGRGVAFQRKSLALTDGGRLARLEDLQPGDILLFAAPGTASSGIQLLTTSPVSRAALYVGDGEVAQALAGGVRLLPVDMALGGEEVVAAFRHPVLDGADAARVGGHARDMVGKPYERVGVMMRAPFALQRRACELPGVPVLLRESCLSTLATLQLIHGGDDRFFCSLFVLEAYRAVGLPLTSARPDWAPPEDNMQMQAGDLASAPLEQPLLYVGHLKLAAFAAPLSARRVLLPDPAPTDPLSRAR